ncbi:microcephalin isoform X1 [Acyrthosiphon pisum]|uniref:BRCT domain-containing protein n=1 Tax=Acyrthosiphon pisum TaxID=7029 RepID=A0A8R1W8H7_ACYPI|nr:microcephalin isoform X1 [Acyrthosiphon pisum]|eukprot:XP_003244772.1 PREDICTED: microcephalin isoform X1 [Acyrthosiphon pisum]
MSRKNTSQRDSGRKKRKLDNDDSDEISLSRNLDLCIDFGFQEAKDSQTSLEGYKDLFGEVIPPDEPVSNEGAKNKLIKKTPRKKKKPNEELFDTPTRPKRVFICTPRFIRVMEEARKELYECMAGSMRSSKVSVVSTDSLNVSGVQHLQDSPQTSINNESKINAGNNDNDKKSQQVFEGVVAFIDYKIDNERCDSSFSERLINMGAKVEKTFNRKVTHVLFCDGYRSTYNKAVERNIPLVSARWMEYSYLAKKMQDPADYPPVDMEKYTKTPSRNIKIPKYAKYKKKLGSHNVKRDNLVQSKCDNLGMNLNNGNEEKCPVTETPQKTTVNQEKYAKYKKKLGSHNVKRDNLVQSKCDNLGMNLNNGNEEKCPITESPQKTTVNQEYDFYKSIDVVKILSNQLRKELNNDVGPVPDAEVDEFGVPMSIRILRKFLTPDGKENTIFKELNNEISKIEDRLNLNFQARKKFRKLLFPSDKDLNNIEDSDFPSQTKDSDSGIMPLNSMIIQTPKVSLADDDAVLQSIAYTGMIKSEAKILKASIKNLGKFIFHSKVKPTTTYLITKSQSNQSLDIVFAMAYGCFIVSEDWVHKSYSIGRWLSHQEYLISDLSEPVKHFQIRRHSTFGSELKFNIFDDVGRIYISDSCESPAKLLRRLVHACGGLCTNTESNANVVVGYTLQMKNNIHEKWILDCITQGILLNKCQYNLVNSNE